MGETYIGAYQTSQSCERCHKSIYADFKESMHARALTSVVMVAENNQAFGVEWGKQSLPDPGLACVNCHSPLATAYANEETEQGTIPFVRTANASADALKEGVGCTTCHSYIGTPRKGFGASSFFAEDFDPSRISYGPFDDAVETKAHKSKVSQAMKTPETLCFNCHQVQIDKNNDGKFDPGVDLILQTTVDEYNDYIAKNGEDTCITCHMPVRSDLDRVADGAKVGTDEQRSVAPSREVHDHKFVGVDFALDDTTQRDLTRGAREDLLKSAIAFNADAVLVNATTVKVSTSITNVNGGHNFPTGFAFARQMWIEVTITNKNKTVLASSGRLVSPTDDLCDNDSLNDGLAAFVSGCAAPDPQLVNFQLKLVDRVAPGENALGKPAAVQDGDGRETTLQFLNGGAVTRRRPIDNEELRPLAFKENRKFDYSFQIAPQQDQFDVTVTLWFRNLPPYFLRALAKNGGKELTENLQYLTPVKIQSIPFVLN